MFSEWPEGLQRAIATIKFRASHLFHPQNKVFFLISNGLHSLSHPSQQMTSPFCHQHILPILGIL